MADPLDQPPSPTGHGASGAGAYASNPYAKEKLPADHLTFGDLRAAELVARARSCAVDYETLKEDLDSFRAGRALLPGSLAASVLALGPHDSPLLACVACETPLMLHSRPRAAGAASPRPAAAADSTQPADLEADVPTEADGGGGPSPSLAGIASKNYVQELSVMFNTEGHRIHYSGDGERYERDAVTWMDDVLGGPARAVARSGDTLYTAAFDALRQATLGTSHWDYQSQVVAGRVKINKSGVPEDTVWLEGAPRSLAGLSFKIVDRRIVPTATAASAAAEDGAAPPPVTWTTSARGGLAIPNAASSATRFHLNRGLNILRLIKHRVNWEVVQKIPGYDRHLAWVERGTTEPPKPGIVITIDEIIKTGSSWSGEELTISSHSPVNYTKAAWWSCFWGYFKPQHIKEFFSWGIEILLCKTAVQGTEGHIPMRPVWPRHIWDAHVKAAKAALAAAAAAQPAPPQAARGGGGAGRGYRPPKPQKAPRAPSGLPLAAQPMMAASPQGSALPSARAVLALAQQIAHQGQAQLGGGWGGGGGPPVMAPAAGGWSGGGRAGRGRGGRQGRGGYAPNPDGFGFTQSVPCPAGSPVHRVDGCSAYCVAIGKQQRHQDERARVLGRALSHVCAVGGGVSVPFTLDDDGPVAAALPNPGDPDPVDLWVSLCPTAADASRSVPFEPGSYIPAAAQLRGLAFGQHGSVCPHTTRHTPPLSVDRLRTEGSHTPYNYVPPNFIDIKGAPWDPVKRTPRTEDEIVRDPFAHPTDHSDSDAPEEPKTTPAAAAADTRRLPEGTGVPDESWEWEPLPKAEELSELLRVPFEAGRLNVGRYLARIEARAERVGLSPADRDRLDVAVCMAKGVLASDGSVHIAPTRPYVDVLLPPVMSTEVQEEIEELIGTGAVILVHGGSQEPGVWYHRMFLVPKPDGGSRVIADLRRPNSFFPAPPAFRHASILEAWSTPGSRARVGTKLDLKSAFHQILMSEDLRRAMYFRDETGRDLTWRALPMGFSWSPYLFDLILRPLDILCRAVGVRCVRYVDDILVVAEDLRALSRSMKVLLDLLVEVGVAVSRRKTYLVGATRLEFLGVIIDLPHATARWAPAKAGKLIDQINKVLRPEDGEGPGSRASLLTIQQIAGRLNFLLQIAPVLRAFRRGLDIQITEWLGAPPNQRRQINNVAKADLEFWSRHGASIAERWWPLDVVQRRTWVAYLDASAEGLGWVLTAPGETVSRSYTFPLPDRLVGRGSGVREYATIRVLLDFLQGLVRHRENLRSAVPIPEDGDLLLIYLDASIVVSSVSKGTARARDMVLAAKEVVDGILSLPPMAMRAIWVPRSLNSVADTASRLPMRTKLREAIIHPERKVWVEDQMGCTIRLDVFATALNAVSERFFSCIPSGGAAGLDGFRQSPEPGAWIFPPPEPSLIEKVLELLDRYVRAECTFTALVVDPRPARSASSTGGQRVLSPLEEFISRYRAVHGPRSVSNGYISASVALSRAAAEGRHMAVHPQATAHQPPPTTGYGTQQPVPVDAPIQWADEDTLPILSKGKTCPWIMIPPYGPRDCLGTRSLQSMRFRLVQFWAMPPGRFTGLGDPAGPAALAAVDGAGSLKDDAIQAALRTVRKQDMLTHEPRSDGEADLPFSPDDGLLEDYLARHPGGHHGDDDDPQDGGLDIVVPRVHQPEDF